jgi:hypothetical protein
MGASDPRAFRINAVTLLVVTFTVGSVMGVVIAALAFSLKPSTARN